MLVGAEKDRNNIVRVAARRGAGTKKDRTHVAAIQFNTMPCCAACGGAVCWDKEKQKSIRRQSTPDLLGQKRTEMTLCGLRGGGELGHNATDMF